MALALYRKYRSADFSEVIGQEHVTAPLIQALTAGRINHAYLFSGPRGCGKTSSARILARSLNCEQGPTPTPCGVCSSCVELAPNGPGSIDVIEIDAASHGGVEDARDLRERAYYAPVRDRYKVYIIDEAHMVTNQGFNALLKLVEEPPEFLVFIFATTEPDKVLQTIRSRTHHYPFRLIPPSVLRAHLERICQVEGVTVEQTVFPLVVRAGAGSARDALSVLDQLLSGAGAEGVTYTRAVGLLGVTDSALLDDMTDSLAVGDAAGVYATIDRVVEAGHDPRRFAADLLDRFRDLIVLDAVPDAVDKGLIDYAGDQALRMTDQARRIGVATLVRFADITHTTLTDMRGTTSPRLMLELLSARMLLPDASSDSAALLQRLERLERRQGMAVPAATAEQPRADQSRAEQPVAAPVSAARRPAKAEPAKAEPVKAEKPVKAEPAKAEEPAGTEPVRSEQSPGAGPDKPEPAQAEPDKPEPAQAEPDKAQPDKAEQPVPAEPVAPSQQPTPTDQPEPALATAVQPAAAAAPDSNALRQLWPEVLTALRERSRVKWAMMNEVVIASVEGEVVNLLAPAGLARRIADESNLSVLREVLQSVVFGHWQLNITSASSSNDGPSNISPAGSPPPNGVFSDAAPSSGSPTNGPPTNGSPSNGSLTNGSPSNGALPDEPPTQSEPAPKAARPERGSRPAQPPVDQPPADQPPVAENDGVDEESDEVRGSQRSGGDAEAAAIELLQTSLGARPIDAP
ncbi:MAG TPA: DNA polymerase III subunit gamma and tau [Jatrophihabitans sp.]|uniref:DNA polymerase III subunit gamma and tau n=1 Tax=Jatrophihabitans sp. TaxID=1932789 RepID=UPI002F220B2A